jgi:hypothetical protein
MSELKHILIEDSYYIVYQSVVVGNTEEYLEIIGTSGNEIIKAIYADQQMNNKTIQIGTVVSWIIHPKYDKNLIIEISDKLKCSNGVITKNTRGFFVMDCAVTGLSLIGYHNEQNTDTKTLSVGTAVNFEFVDKIFVKIL